MKRFVLGCCAAALAATVCNVANGGQVSGTVTQLIVRASDGLTYVYINGISSGKPACAVFDYWMIMLETSDAGHKQYEMLLQAVSTRATVTIVGNNTCTRWSDGEDINSVYIQ